MNGTNHINTYVITEQQNYNCYKIKQNIIQKFPVFRFLEEIWTILCASLSRQYSKG
jgi:hypothetical protein